MPVKNRIDLAIEQFAALEKPTAGDLARVKVTAQMQAGLDAYRAQAKKMTVEELEDEEHNSARLGRFLETTGQPRPHPLCDAHAIISGGHTRAAELRAILAWFQMRIDDPHNGCWLPRNTEAKKRMPRTLAKAVPHSRIHRNGYYMWLESFISTGLIEDEKALINALKMATMRLQSSTFPSYVMLPADKLKN